MTQNASQTTCKLAKDNCFKDCPVKTLSEDLQTYWNDGLVEASGENYLRKARRFEELTGMSFTPE